jgi:hypothetical protein
VYSEYHSILEKVLRIVHQRLMHTKQFKIPPPYYIENNANRTSIQPTNPANQHATRKLCSRTRENPMYLLITCHHGIVVTLIPVERRPNHSLFLFARLFLRSLLLFRFSNDYVVIRKINSFVYCQLFQFSQSFPHLFHISSPFVSFFSS